MNPKRFFYISGAMLITIGVLGIFGILGRISSMSFFHPPYWINWVHLSLGVFVLIIALRGSRLLQERVVLFPMVLGLTLGVVGLLFGRYFADRYALPELADPSDHVAHLIVGLTAMWAWRNRTKRS